MNLTSLSMHTQLDKYMYNQMERLFEEEMGLDLFSYCSVYFHKEM